MTVEDIAQTDVVTATEDTPLTELVAQMNENDVGSVVIVDGESPVSLVTDRKIALSLDEAPDVSDRRASDVMTEDLVTVPTDTGIFEVIQTLGEEGIRRVPVVDEQEQLKGIVSLDDVIMLLETEFGNVSDVIEAQSPRY